MATEKRNENATIKCLLAILVLNTYIVKHIAICQALVAKKTKVATKLMKIVLCCTRFELNEP
jgi:hypothetical protein